MINIYELITELKKENKPIDLSIRSTFVNNLVYVCQIIKASEGLLITAIDELKKIDGDFEDELRKYYESHLEEERGHYEWLIDDLSLESMDLNWRSVEMAGVQYYLIKHIHPVALLGYMAVLEGDPFPLKLVDELETLHGGKLCRTLRYHAENDINHSKDLLKIIQLVPEKWKDLIIQNATTTVRRIGFAQMNMGVCNG